MMMMRKRSIDTTTTTITDSKRTNSLLLPKNRMSLPTPRLTIRHHRPIISLTHSIHYVLGTFINIGLSGLWSVDGVVGEGFMIIVIGGGIDPVGNVNCPIVNNL